MDSRYETAFAVDGTVSWSSLFIPMDDDDGISSSMGSRDEENELADGGAY